MTLSSRDLAWSKAFARQALSDLRAMEHLRNSPLERCHWLHYLQMAAEKVCKAHLALAGQDQVRKIHGYVSRTLPVIARSFLSEEGTKNPHSSWQLSQVRKFSHEIALLAPATHDSLTRLDNCEYPWEAASGSVLVPCEQTFPGVREDRTLTLIVRVLRKAAEEYSE